MYTYPSNMFNADHEEREDSDKQGDVNEESLVTGDANT